MSKREQIINGIISRGGLYGQIASRMAAQDLDGFVIECFEQCHNYSAREHWGDDLVMDIINYRLDLIRIPLKELLARREKLVRVT